MPPIGDNLASRAAAILLGSFALASLLLALFVVRPSRDQPASSLLQLPVPAETRAIVDALEASSPRSRPLVVKALSSSVTSVHLAPGFPPLPPGLRRAPRLGPLLEAYTRPLGDRAVRVELTPRAALRQLLGVGSRDATPASVRLLVALKSGGVLVIEHRAPAVARAYLARAAGLFAAVAAILLAGLTLAVRQTARPVRLLARSARQFSLDRAAPDLPIEGPREVRELAAAFNDMQRHIRGLVSDRTRLLAAVAHDLRTYLTRLRLRAEFIEDGEQRARAERDIAEMSQLLDDTLLFAEHTARPAAEAAPCDAAVEIAALARARAEQGEEVALNDAPVAGGALSLACPAASFRRMLNNLVDNAIRYGDRARIAVREAGGEVEITVEDDGPGVPAEALADLTRPFLRLETSRARATGGAGLGLAIVKSLAESCGGSLALSNGPGGGLRATLTLPAASAAPAGGRGPR